MNLHKLSRIVVLVVAVLSLVLAGGVMATSDEADSSPWITPILTLSYIVLFISVALVLLYVIKNLFSNKENLKRTLIVVGIFLGIALLSFLIADSSEVFNGKREVIATSTTSKLVSTGLNMSYILSFLSIALLVFFGIKKAK